MADANDLIELDGRIAGVREDMRRLTEQAATSSGPTGEERTASRIADLESMLAVLIQERDALA